MHALHMTPFRYPRADIEPMAPEFFERQERHEVPNAREVRPPLNSATQPDHLSTARPDVAFRSHGHGAA